MTSLGVHPSLDPNCQQQINFVKLNLKTYYLLPYSQEIWRYKDENTDQTRCAKTKLNFERAFFTANTNEKVAIFNKAF